MDKRLKKILIKTKKEVFSSQIGNNISKLKGEGYDFVELREYEEGEDIRKIDWMISAKMNKPYVKVFHVQKQLNINIVSLLGGSMHFGTKGFKQDILTEICSILGYASIANQDSFTSFIANEELQVNTTSNKTALSVEKMCENLYRYEPLGKSIAYDFIFKELFNKIRKKSLIFLVGDFIGFSTLDLRLLAKKHQVIALIVRDKFEESYEEFGNVRLVDPSTLNTFEGSIDKSSIKRFQQKVHEDDLVLYKHFQECGIEFTKVYTHENPLIKILKLFQ